MPTRNPQQLPERGKIIAFDVGARVVGIAVSDTGRAIASPRPALKRGKWSTDREILQELIKKEAVTAAVVGLPLNMSGEAGPAAQSATAFAQNLETDLGLPVLLWDERLTTTAAEAAMFEARTGRQSRMSRKDAKQKGVDSVAAALILQGVLGVLSF